MIDKSITHGWKFKYTVLALITAGEKKSHLSPLIVCLSIVKQATRTISRSAVASAEIGRQETLFSLPVYHTCEVSRGTF